MADAQRQSLVRCELERLEKSITGLHNSIGNLNDRLSSILKSESPEKSNTCAKEAKESVDLSRILERYVSEIYDATSKIDSFITRCEL